MDNHRRSAGGYTIVEVIIVLTVSALLFAASVVGYSLQNRRTEFTDSVNNFAQDIQDALGQVQTGFYPSNNSFSCSANASGGVPIINYGGSAKQGGNTDCIFLGKAIQFGPFGTNKAAIDIYTVVGRRLKAGTTDPVINIADASPIALDNLIQRKTLDAGVQISSVKSADGSHSYAGFAMVSTSSSSGISTGLNNRASLAAVIGGINNAKTTFLNRVQLINDTSITNASGGLNVCVKEPGPGGRTAIIQLADNSSQIIVNTEIDQPCS